MNPGRWSPMAYCMPNQPVLLPGCNTMPQPMVAFGANPCPAPNNLFFGAGAPSFMNAGVNEAATQLLFQLNLMVAAMSLILLQQQNTGPSSGSVQCASQATGQLSNCVPAKVRQWEPQIMSAAQKYNVPPAMIAAVMAQESGGNPKAGSCKGAKGLMQFMDNTFESVARRHCIQGDIWDPAANIEAGAAYLKNLHDRFGSWDLTLAAYNAGPGAVKKHGGIPPFAETQRYVPGVLEKFQQYQQNTALS